MEYLTHNLEETQKVAESFVGDVFLNLPEKGATVIGLYGELGSGKTTFTQAVAKYLGVQETVVSPTFVIEKIYDLALPGRPFFKLIHIDAYRLEKSSELLHLGWQEIISHASNLILIEWPERVSDIMPPHIKVEFSHVSENERKIEIK